MDARTPPRRFYEKWTSSDITSLSLAIVAAAVAFASVGFASQDAKTRPIRALYVTGGGFHDFVTQETIVPPGLAKRARIDWTIDHSAGKSTDVLIERHKTTDWTNAFDVVVYNMSFSNVVDPAWIERITAAHRNSGVSAVILHGAVHSYRRSESKAWGEMMGAFSMRHDKQRPLTVDVVAKDHPIMRGFPDKWQTINDELYEIERVWPSMTPLAQAYSEETKKSSPIVWINTHGKARIFVTSLGHNNEMMANPVYLDLVSRGLLWTLDRLPADGGRKASAATSEPTPQATGQISPADVAPFLGEWTLSLQGPNGPGTFTLTVGAEKEKATGEIVSPEIPKQPITSMSLVNKSLALRYSFTWEGNPVDAVVTLTPGDEGKMTAQIDFAGGAYLMTGSATKNDKKKN